MKPTFGYFLLMLSLMMFSGFGPDVRRQKPTTLEADCSLGPVEGCAIGLDDPEPESNGPICPKVQKLPPGIVCADCVEKIQVPAACYPALAKMAGISGVIKVKVVIDNKGKVIWARALDGNPLLKGAALNAACRTDYSAVTCERQDKNVQAFLYFKFTREPN